MAGKRFVEIAGHASGIPGYIPGNIGSGRQIVALAGSAVQLASSAIIGQVIIVAEFNNTGTMCIGDSGVIANEATREGVPLKHGDAVIITIDDISKIWIDSTIDGDGVTYLIVK